MGSIRHWAWRRFIRWTALDIDPDCIPTEERWPAVQETAPAVFRARYIEPARRRLLARSPAWLVTLGLQRRTHQWYRVPSRAGAEHIRLRFDFWPIEVGDHVRIERGRLTAICCALPTVSEIIFVQPNGEPEPDPHSPEMSKAWAAFWESKGR